MHRRRLDWEFGSPLLMMTMSITPRVALWAGHEFAVAASGSLVVPHQVSDAQHLKTMIDGPA